MTRFAMILAAAGLLITAACKPSPTAGASQAKSLDNLVAKDGTALVENDCSGPYVNTEYAQGEHIDVPANLRDDFYKALSSIPLSLRELFATKMIGQFTVSEKAASLCGAAMQNISEGRLKSGAVDTTACLRATAGEPGVELILPANGKSLRHSLVRGFFAAVFRVMASADYDVKLKLFKSGQAPQEFAQIERSLALALREDLADKGGDPVRMRQIFGASLANARESGAMAKAFDGLSAAEKDVVGLAVVRETADQYYCSAKTRQTMRGQFPKTYQAFKTNWVTMAHQALEEKNPEELLGESGGTAAAAANSSSGLSLWGAWGAGDGPLRSWIGSRLDARAEGGAGLFPNWNLARQGGAAEGGTGLFPNWNLARQNSIAQLQSDGLPGKSLFPGFWATRLLGGDGDSGGGD